MNNNATEYFETVGIVSISDDLLNDYLGERDWHEVIIMHGDDIALRKRRRDEVMGGWVFAVLARDGFEAKDMDAIDMLEQIKNGEIITDIPQSGW